MQKESDQAVINVFPTFYAVIERQPQASIQIKHLLKTRPSFDPLQYSNALAKSDVVLLWGKISILSLIIGT